MRTVPVFLLLLSCTSRTEVFDPELSQAVKNQIELEVNQISNAEELIIYLKEIQRIDQESRSRSSEAEIEFGFDSKESENARIAMMQLDLENLGKVELILAKFGYPGKDVVGRNVSDIPLVVIHHSQSYPIRKKHFSMLYEAYLDQQINEGLFAFYLERMYRMKFDKRFDMPKGKPYKLEQEVDTLIQLLDLK